MSYEDNQSCFTQFEISDELPNEYPWNTPFDVVDKVAPEIGEGLCKRLMSKGCQGTAWKILAETVELKQQDILFIEQRYPNPPEYVLKQYALRPDNTTNKLINILRHHGMRDAAKYLIERCEAITGKRGQGGRMCHSLEGQRMCSRDHGMEVDEDTGSSKVHSLPPSHAHGYHYQPHQHHHSHHHHQQQQQQQQHPHHQQQQQQHQHLHRFPGLGSGSGGDKNLATISTKIKAEPFDDPLDLNSCGRFNTGPSAASGWSTDTQFDSGTSEPMDTLDASSVIPTGQNEKNSVPKERPVPLLEGMPKGQYCVDSITHLPVHALWPFSGLEMHSGMDPRSGLPQHCGHSQQREERPLNLTTVDPTMPVMNQTVQIKAEAQWDEGYSRSFEDAQPPTYVKQEPGQTFTPSCMFDPSRGSIKKEPSVKDEFREESAYTSTDSSYFSLDESPVKGHARTFPRCKKDEENPSTVALRGSSSLQGSLTSTDFGTSPRQSRIFLTYSNDNDSHIKRVIDLNHSLRKNGFAVTLDEVERKLVAPGDHKKYLTQRYRAANYVLVCVSPRYYGDIMGRTQPVGGQHQLNARFIYSLMNEELKEPNKRIIPVIFEQSGGKKCHMPPLLVNLFKYRWPEQYKHVFYHLMEPEKVLQKILKRHPHAKNFPAGNGVPSSGGHGTHHSGPI